MGTKSYRGPRDSVLKNIVALTSDTPEFAAVSIAGLMAPPAASIIVKTVSRDGQTVIGMPATCPVAQSEVRDAVSGFPTPSDEIPSPVIAKVADPGGSPLVRKVVVVATVRPDDDDDEQVEYRIPNWTAH